MNPFEVKLLSLLIGLNLGALIAFLTLLKAEGMKNLGFVLFMLPQVALITIYMFFMWNHPSTPINRAMSLDIFVAFIAVLGWLIEGHLADRPWTRPKPHSPHDRRGSVLVWSNVALVTTVGAGFVLSPVISFIVAPCWGLFLAYLSVRRDEGGPAPKWL